MKIGELARRSGMKPDTLRFYERIGLVPRPARDAGGRRDYEPAVLDWLVVLGRLNATGMKQADRIRYAALRRQGDVTLGERRAMIETHRAAIAVHIQELTAALSLMDDKIATYRRMEADHDQQTS